MFQIFNHNSWQFVDSLVQTYGPLAKLQGFFGVGSSTVFKSLLSSN